MTRSALQLALLFIVTITYAASAAQQQQQTLNDRPIIGILTQPVKSNPTQSYLVAAYVKWIEQAVSCWCAQSTLDANTIFILKINTQTGWPRGTNFP